MKASAEKKLRNLFATKTGGPVYQLFYDGKMYRQKEGGEVLLSKHQVLEALGVAYDEMSAPERAFVDRLWNSCILRFQRRAWDMMQPWGTIRVRHKSGANIWLHGYTLDPAKQEAMKRQKHWQSVGHYISEKRQERAFSKSMGYDAQIELPIREELMSFEIE